MGLGLTIRFPVGQTKQTDKKRYEQYFQGVSSMVPQWKIRTLFGEDGFCVQLLPFEEEVYGYWEEGALRISAKTNSAGPGYHAYLVDLLDGLGVAPIEVDDETAYYKNRDFSALQAEMMAWLRGLGGQLLKMSDQGDYSDLAVSLPIGSVPVGTGRFTCCPLGYFEKAFFAAAQNGAEVGSQFFIWWNQRTDALFFRNAALNLIWCENNWLFPVTDEEDCVIAATLDCLEKAYSLNPALEYPDAEWLELAQLSGDEALEKKLHARFPKIGESVLGYRRGLVCDQVNGWRFSHSGQMHFKREEDGSPVWWDGDRTIRPSVISVDFKETTENGSESLLASATINESGYERIALRNSKIAAKIQHQSIEEDGNPVWQTRLVAALDNELFLFSLYYEDETDRDWAIGLCASVTR